MPQLRLLFYEEVTGNRLYDCSYQGPYIEPTFEQIYNAVPELNIRDSNSIGMIRYANGEYEEDFNECGANFRIDLATLTPLFSYPDPNAPQEPQVFVKPLTEQVREVKAQTEQLNEDLFALSEYVTGGI